VSLPADAKLIAFSILLNCAFGFGYFFLKSRNPASGKNPGDLLFLSWKGRCRISAFFYTGYGTMPDMFLFLHTDFFGL
jgi:hypothetical protein